MICLSCFDHLATNGQYHPACIERLFGSRTLPFLDVRLDRFARLAAIMVGKVSLSGVQAKLALTLLPEENRLTVTGRSAHYILKPQIHRLTSIPELEAVAMRMAQRAGILVPPFALMTLEDGSLAYVIRRFDRLPGAMKLQVEDFCQLSLKPPKDKYSGSAERCAAIIKRHASEPIVQLHRYFRQTVFSWWIGNQDLHLKNLSLMTQDDDMVVLSPAYDILPSKLYFPEFDVALTVGGKASKLRRKDWLALAERCDLTTKAAERVLADIAALQTDAVALIGRAPLGIETRQDLVALIGERTAILAV